MKLRLVALLLLTLACIQAGCATTATWSEASRQESYNPTLVGAVREGPAESGAATELVINYYTAISSSTVHEYYIALPLGKQGAPPRCLAYTGPSRTPPEIAGDYRRPGQQRWPITSSAGALTPVAGPRCGRPVTSRFPLLRTPHSAPSRGRWCPTTESS